MPKLGRLKLDGRVPVVAVPFVDRVAPREVHDAVQAGLDVAELRLDRYAGASRTELLEELEKFGDVPTIATVRCAAEGGAFEGSERDRLSLLAALAPRASAVDIELSAKEIRSDVILAAHAADCLVITSFHDFDGTPHLSTLTDRIDEAVALGADIVKIATMARSDEDVRTLARLLLSRPDSNLVVIAMGPHGRKSRVFFPALGSLITFAARDSSTAPGQLELEEMVSILADLYPDYATRKDPGDGEGQRALAP